MIWPISSIEIFSSPSYGFLVVFSFNVDWKDCSDVWLACGQARIQVPSCDHSAIEEKEKATDGKICLVGRGFPPGGRMTDRAVSPNSAVRSAKPLWPPRKITCPLTTQFEPHLVTNNLEPHQIGSRKRGENLIVARYTRPRHALWQLN